MHLASAGTVVLANCTLRANRARSGGGLAAVASTTVQLRGSALDGNVASVQGGGLMCILASLDSEEDVYTNNSAAAGGGAPLSDRACCRCTRACCRCT